MKFIKTLLILVGILQTAVYAQTLPKQAVKLTQEYSIDDFLKYKDRLDTLNLDIAENGVLNYVPYNTTLLTGYAYHQVYDWDAYFESLYLSYYGVDDYCFNNTKSFLRQQKADGFISRTINESRPKQHFKPFLAQMAELGSRQRGDYSWLNEKIEDDTKSIFERLELSIEYWFTSLDSDKNGLPVWNSADHSGMDNQVSRAGKIDAFQFEGVDLASYIYREYKAMEAMAKKLGKKDKQKAFAAKAATLAANVNEILWDETDGIYYDRDEKSGKAVKVKCVSAFTALWAGIVPKDRAKRLIEEHLTNPEEFWTTYPIATYAKTEKDFNPGRINGVCNWRGTTWIPTNYMIFHGLVDYGYTDIAKEVASKTLDLVYKQNNITREFYHSITGEGLGLPRFWGWSSLGYIMPLEMSLKYDPSKIGSKVKPIVTENLNIQFPKPTKELIKAGMERMK